jgi:hypothetical protein
MSQSFLPPWNQGLPFLESTGPSQEDEVETMDWETSYVGEIRKMWPDSLQESTHPSNAGTEQNNCSSAKLIYLVLDTNIWIGHSDLIKTLLDTEFIKGSLPVVVIPWMVLQELDEKKGNDRKNKRPIEEKGAQSATKFMHELLLKRHPRVIGQRASEAANSEKEFEPRNPDDQILLCALQWSNRHPDSFVVFVTNDKNLLSKALIETVSQDGKYNKVIVCDSASVVDKIKSYVLPQRHIRTAKRGHLKHKPSSYSSDDKNTSQSQEKSNSCHPVSKSNSFKRPRGSTAEKRPAIEVPKNQSIPIPLKKQFTEIVTPKCDTFKNVLDLLQKVFSNVIETKMKEDFGDGWLYALKIKPPWTLQSALQCIIAHWIAVFSFVFGSKALVHAESLMQAVKQHKKSWSLSNTKTSDISRKQDEEDIIELAVSLFNTGKLKKSSVLDDVEIEMRTCRQALLDYLEKTKV